MKPGIYRVFALQHGAKTERAYLGRVVVSNGHTHIVEDRNGKLSKVIPDGAIDKQKEQRWNQLHQSPYFQVTSEADLEPQDVQQPTIPPDESFTLIDDVLGTRRHLEAYGDDFFLDGAHLSPEQAQQIMSKVRLGELHLLPAGVK